MAVAFDAKTATVTSVNATTTLTISNLTVGSGSNRAMVVIVHWLLGVFPSGVTATWDSGGSNQAMTLVPGTTSASGTSSCSTAIYGLVAPTSGNKSLVISWTGNAEAHATAVSFTGVDQTSVAVAFPNGVALNKTTATASPASTGPITSSASDMVVSGFSEQVSAWGAISGTTIAQDSSTGPQLAVAYSYASGAGAVTQTAAFTGSSLWTAHGCDVLAFGGGAAVTLGRTSPNLFLPNQGPLRGLKPTQAFPLASTPVSASLTGVASTSAAGTPTVTGFSNLTLTGVQSASAAGIPTVTGFANLTLTGVASTSAAGIPTVTGFANVTINGVAATSAANVPTVTGFANVSLTGVSSASAAGIPTVTGFANVTLTGVASASQIGTISVTVGGAVNVNLTGVSATGSAGTPTVTGFANVPLTGVAATGSAGTVSVVIPVSVSLTGVAATSAAGIPTVTGFANVTLSGIAATGTAADVTVNVPASVSVGLIGVQSNIVVGTLSTNLDVVTVTPTVPQSGGAGSVSTRGRTSPLASKPLVRSRSAYLSAINRDESRSSESRLEELKQSTSLTAPKIEPKAAQPFTATLAQLGAYKRTTKTEASGFAAQMQREAQIALETKRRRDDDEALALLLLT